MNATLSIVELFSFDNRILGIAKDIYKELVTGFTAAFFSTRRHFMGKQWLEENNHFEQ